MIKNKLYIAAAIVICTLSIQLRASNYSSSLSSPSGMINYLNDLPAVKNLAPWPNQYGSGIVISTRHYKIYTTLLDPLMLRQVPSFIESAYDAYNSQLPSPIETYTPFTIYLFDNRQQWESFTRSFTGANAGQYLAIKEGAYFLNGACVVYNIGRKQTFNVLGHEGWHQFNNKHFTYRLPSWLDEGIATLFEVSEPVKGKFIFNPSANFNRLVNLKYTIMSYNMIPLDQLIALNPAQIIGAHAHNQKLTSDDETKVVVAYYSQCYALARFLREDGFGKRLKRYHAMLLGGQNGTWPLDATLSQIASNRNVPLTVKWNSFISPRLFDLYIQEDTKRLEKEYKAFCQKITYNIRTATTTTNVK